MEPNTRIISWRKGYCLKIKIRPVSIKINNDVQPKITANIKGSVFLKPKLNPEYDAVILLGPGVNAVTKPNIIRFSKSGYIVYAISKPLSAF